MNWFVHHCLPHAGGLALLLLVLLAAGIALLAVALPLMARMLLSPPRMDDAKAAWMLLRRSPADLKLAYESIEFLVRDERSAGKIKIAAWWMGHPQSQGRCVILIHGYSDAKVGAIAWAPTWHDLGYNILAIDLRAHGQSTGRHTTGGFFERRDLSQIIDEIRAQKSDETRSIVLFGVSLGAAVAAATAVWRDEELGLRDIDAVIMECPYADYRSAIRSHARVLGMPGGAIADAAIWCAQKISGADFSAVRPVELIGKIPCPILVIRSDADLFVTPTDAAMIESAVAARPARLGLGIYWQAQNAHHVAALYQDPILYCRRLAEFLTAAAPAFHAANPPAPPPSSERSVPIPDTTPVSHSNPDHPRQ